MRILQIIPSLRKGGAERLVLDILREFLSRKNKQIKLVVFRNEIDYSIVDIEEHIKIIPSSVSLSLKRKPILQIDELQKFIEEFEPNIIHTHLFEAELVSHFCHYPQATWFSHIHDNILQLKNFSFKSLSNKQALTNYFEKSVLFKNYQKNGGTHFIAISKHTEPYIKSVQSKYPVTLLHNAINVNRFQRRLSDAKGYATQNLIENGGLSGAEEHHYNSPPHALNEVKVLTPRTERSRSANSSLLTIINIGSFVPKKNQTFLLDIIVELNKLNQKVNCIFLGDGPLKVEVEQRVKDLNLYDQCQFLGNVENVEEYLWKSDIYFHTATYEPLGLVLLEAMAAGLPVVTLDGGGNRDLMENGKNGFILNEQNPKLFAEKILEVKYNEAMKKYNVQFAQKFDIDNYTNKLLELYQSALKNH
jgi:glycosyltransferase involved in cell wall biosynthesis